MKTEQFEKQQYHIYRLIEIDKLTPHQEKIQTTTVNPDHREHPDMIIWIHNVHHLIIPETLMILLLIFLHE